MGKMNDREEDTWRHRDHWLSFVAVSELRGESFPTLGICILCKEGNNCKCLPMKAGHAGGGEKRPEKAGLENRKRELA